MIGAASGAEGFFLETCPACGSSARTGAGQKGSLRLVRCKACHLTYANPQFRELVSRRYNEEYDLAAHFERSARRKQVLFERRVRYLPHPTPGKDRLCDVGCGDGQFMALAAARGWRTFGVDMNPPAVARARSNGLSVVLGEFENIDLPWGTFSVVTAWDVIEHTPEPKKFVQRLLRLLAPGGVLFLSTLNAESLVARLFRMRWSMVVEDHFTYWSPQSLVRLLESSGAQVVMQITTGIGRDFVSWMGRGHTYTADRDADSGLRVWDVSPVVLRVESLVNSALERTGRGVELFVEARPASR